MASHVAGGPPQRNQSGQQVICHDEGPHDNRGEHRTVFFAGTDYYLGLADKVLDSQPRNRHDNHEAHPG